MKDIIKYLIGTVIIVFVVIYTAKFFSFNKDENKLNTFSFGSLVGCLDETIPTMGIINKEYSELETDKNNSYLEKFIKTEISTMKAMEEIKEHENNEIELEYDIGNEENRQLEEESKEINLADTQNIKTEIVTQNPISENYNAQYGNVKIKNQTSYTLTEQILKPDIEINNKNIVIFHTHSCESYTSSEKYQYIPTGNYRTTDLKYTVTGVGTELENYFKKYNFNVIHDTSYHDYPSYSGSYTRSLQTVENIIKSNPSDIVIDLHRDAIGSRADYSPTVKIGDDYAAQIMFVIGTNQGGLWHPNWQQNLKFAIKIQEKAEEMYPGLFKPIMLTTSRYNQHVTKYANIIEVGATGNTLEQCFNSMKYLAAVMNEILNN